MSEDNKFIRLFMGIPAPDSCKQEYEVLKDSLSDKAWLSWTKLENLHITSLFLGNVNADMLDNLIELFAYGHSQIDAFELTNGRWQWAPKGHDIRMLWLQFQKSPDFNLLVKSSQGWFSQIQPFPQQWTAPIPHMTSARCNPHKFDPQTRLPEHLVCGSIKVDKLALWRSDQLDGGIRYTKLAGFALRS
ncbi:MAG: RNA 2',3'-cyclic phosphodiesterase [Bacteroidia bacterium]|nr:RNA 2',3'-cyclic phosphodiesterase [Bacteroidia bacterium]